MSKIGGSKGYLEKRYEYLLYFYTNDNILNKKAFDAWKKQFAPLEAVGGMGDMIRLYRNPEQRTGQFPTHKLLLIYGFNGDPAKMKKAVAKLKVSEGTSVIFYKAIAPLLEKNEFPQDEEEHIFMALTNARKGKEKEYNEWYNNHHVPDVVRMHAYRSGRRYQVLASAGDEAPYEYLALYRYGGSHMKMTMALIDYVFAGGNILMSKLYEKKDAAWVYSEITPGNKAEATDLFAPKAEKKVDFYDAIKRRRSVYVTSADSPIPDDKLLEILKEVTENSPSSFNSQSSRVVVLLGKESDDFWDIVLDTLRKVTPKEMLKATEDKIEMLSTCHGTLLYYEDMDIVKGLQDSFPIYKDSFPIWAEHGNAMLQYAIWTALSIEGFGATLQHYNPIIDEAVAKRYNIPASWKLIGQMPFGGVSIPADPIRHIPIEAKLIIKK